MSLFNKAASLQDKINELAGELTSLNYRHEHGLISDKLFSLKTAAFVCEYNEIEISLNEFIHENNVDNLIKESLPDNN